MKCIRIFPEIWASTRCPLSSSTLNMAFGNVSTTVPSTAITSSLATVPLSSKIPCGRQRLSRFHQSLSHESFVVPGQHVGFDLIGCIHRHSHHNQQRGSTKI